MGPKPRLFTLPISHYCVSVERMLAFKGIAYDAVPTPYHDRQQLIRESGQDYVPTLIHGQSAVTWQQIPDYLEKLKPNPTLYPAGWKGTAVVLEDWGHQVLEERVWRAVVTKVPPVLGSDEERWVFEEMQTRARGPWSVLQSRRDEFHRDMVTHLALVDRMLEGRSWTPTRAQRRGFRCLRRSFPAPHDRREHPGRASQSFPAGSDASKLWGVIRATPPFR